MINKFNKLKKKELDKLETDNDMQNLNIGAIINQVSMESAQVSQVSKQNSNSNQNGSNINANFSNFNVNINQSVQNNVSVVVVNSFDKSDNANEDVSDESSYSQGGNCDMYCKHYCEEYYDSYGGVVGSIDGEGYTEYYCSLGHSLGGFCEDYE